MFIIDNEKTFPVISFSFLRYRVSLLCNNYDILISCILYFYILFKLKNVLKTC